MDKETLEEAVKEVADMFLEDVIRKGKLRKHMGLLPTFREHWAVLQPTLITLYSSSREKEVQHFTKQTHDSLKGLSPLQKKQ